MRHLLCLIATTALMSLGNGVDAQSAVDHTPVNFTKDSTSGVSLSVAVNATNALRAQKGLRPLRYSKTLQKVAQRHANDMARNNFFSHTGSDGTRVSHRLKRAGYNYCAAAENVSYGAKTTARAIEQWRGSAGHYRNMIGKSYREFGLARAPGNRWVMVLGAKMGKC